MTGSRPEGAPRTMNGRCGGASTPTLHSPRSSGQRRGQDISDGIKGARADTEHVTAEVGLALLVILRMRGAPTHSAEFCSPLGRCGGVFSDSLYVAAHDSAGLCALLH